LSAELLQGLQAALQRNLVAARLSSSLLRSLVALLAALAR
jgi:hypothetical protein